jgi:hypothetical protein
MFSTQYQRSPIHLRPGREMLLLPACWYTCRRLRDDNPAENILSYICDQF